MGSFSKVVLLGNLTRDPVTGSLPSGATVCEFGLAVNRRWKDADGQMRDEDRDHGDFLIDFGLITWWSSVCNELLIGLL